MEDGGVVATFEVCCLAYVIPILFTVFSVVQIITIICLGPRGFTAQALQKGQRYSFPQGVGHPIDSMTILTSCNSSFV
jgi:hypothetical protein